MSFWNKVDSCLGLMCRTLVAIWMTFDSFVSERCVIYCHLAALGTRPWGQETSAVATSLYQGEGSSKMPVMMRLFSTVRPIAMCWRASSPEDEGLEI